MPISLARLRVDLLAKSKLPLSDFTCYGFASRHAFAGHIVLTCVHLRISQNHDAFMYGKEVFTATTVSNVKHVKCQELPIAS